MDAKATKPHVVCEPGRHVGCLHDRPRAPAKPGSIKTPRRRTGR